jgi:hypothetical protein
VLAAAVSLLGCEAGPTTQPSATVSVLETTAPGATRTPAVDLVMAAAIGPWRSQPLPPDRAFSAPFEASCRVAEPAIASLPMAVVDLRGASLLTIVFADASTAYVCWIAIESPDKPEAIRRLEVPSTTLADDDIDLLLYASTTRAGMEATWVIGRLGSTPRFVITGFPDESYVFGAHAGGWYAMWWPGTGETDNVAATDGRHVVLNEARAPRTTIP